MTDAVQDATAAATKAITKAAATAAAKKAKAEAEKTAQTVVADAKNIPESVTLAAPHGFIDEATGEAHVWLQHEVVTAKEEIELLIERGARLFGINGEPEAPAKAK